MVEFKELPPAPPKFGAAAASFANTLGGWIVIGVRDRDRAIVGWTELNPRTDVQSHLGALLREEVDPLPPFVAERRELDGKTIVVMRVFESADAPHIVRGTGALYIRTAQGKQPIEDQRMLFELARRGRDAMRDAEARLGTDLVVNALRRPDERSTRGGQECWVLQVTVRAAPLTVAPSLRSWPISASGARWVEHSADVLVPPLERHYPGAHPPLPLQSYVSPRPRARGHTASCIVEPPDKTPSPQGWIPLYEALTCADSAGVLGAAVRKRFPGSGALVSVEEHLRPMIELMIEEITTALTSAEAYGRAAWRVNILLPVDASVTGQRVHPGACSSPETNSRRRARRTRGTRSSTSGCASTCVRLVCLNGSRCRKGRQDSRHRRGGTKRLRMRFPGGTAFVAGRLRAV